MEDKLIDEIYIRAKDENGKWGSFSLGDLVDMKLGNQAFRWLIERLSGMKEGEEITREALENLAHLLPEDSYVRIPKNLS